MQDFGPVEREENEPPFHAEWEEVMFAIQMSVVLGQSRVAISLDEVRSSIERMDPVHYLTVSYFEHWLDGMTRLLIERDVITSEELDARTTFFEQHADSPATAAQSGPPAAPGPAVMRGGPPGTMREATSPPRFAAGDTIVTRTDSPVGHTRIPRYARGRHGVVERCYGVYVFPDSNALGLGESPQPVYSVRFDAQDLWGAGAEPNQSVNLDLWESYLESKA